MTVCEDIYQVYTVKYYINLVCVEARRSEKSIGFVGVSVFEKSAFRSRGGHIV